jgi:hypothetical protein
VFGLNGLVEPAFDAACGNRFNASLRINTHV